MLHKITIICFHATVVKLWNLENLESLSMKIHGQLAQPRTPMAQYDSSMQAAIPLCAQSTIISSSYKSHFILSWLLLLLLLCHRPWKSGWRCQLSQEQAEHRIWFYERRNIYYPSRLDSSFLFYNFKATFRVRWLAACCNSPGSSALKNEFVQKMI